MSNETCIVPIKKRENPGHYLEGFAEALQLSVDMLAKLETFCTPEEFPGDFADGMRAGFRAAKEGVAFKITRQLFDKVNLDLS